MGNRAKWWVDKCRCEKSDAASISNPRQEWLDWTSFDLKLVALMRSGWCYVQVLQRRPIYSISTKWMLSSSSPSFVIYWDKKVGRNSDSLGNLDMSIISFLGIRDSVMHNRRVSRRKYFGFSSLGNDRNISIKRRGGWWCGNRTIQAYHHLVLTLKYKRSIIKKKIQNNGRWLPCENLLHSG